MIDAMSVRKTESDSLLPATTNPKKAARLYFLDWLRIIAYLILVLYHAALIFSGWKYYVQNSMFSDAFRLPMQFVNPWRMPLLFFVSGVGVSFTLGLRSIKVFFIERVLRLIVPFGFGITVLVPPVYFFQTQYSALEISYFQFFSDYFSTNWLMKWSHLWFIAYLVVFILTAMPLLVFLRSPKGKLATQRIASFLSNNGFRLLWLVIPLFLIEYFFSDMWSGKRRIFNDMYHALFYFTIFLYGYFVGSVNILWKTFERERRAYLFLGLICFAIFYTTWVLNGDAAKERPHSNNLIIDLIWCLNILSWIVCSLGYARRYLNFDNPVLKYCNQAALPLYLLHHPILIALGYYTVKLDIGITEKFLIVSAGTFLMTVFLYEYIIKRSKLLRILFGIRSSAK